MPPKKAAVEAVNASSPGDEATAAKENTKDLVSIEDHSLPKSIVTRLAKGVLPANTQIQGNATLAITKGATVFVNYLASHANEICQREGRKTLNPQDVLRALDELEFPDFKPRLEAELAKFNEIQLDKRTNYKAKKASEKSVTTMDAAPGEAAADGGVQEAHDGEPVTKKARREVGDRVGGGHDVEDSYVSAAGEGGAKDDTDVEEEEDDEEVEDEEDTLEVDEGVEDEVDEREEADEEEEEEDEALDNGGDSD